MTHVDSMGTASFALLEKMENILHNPTMGMPGLSQGTYLGAVEDSLVQEDGMLVR